MEKPVYFDESIAPFYDATSAEMFRPEVLHPTVDFLAALAAGGTALEFAIGTGRVAVPLSERGVRVSGIEYSPAMVDQLLAKPNAARLDVTIGDMSVTRIDGQFDLVYLVFNTIMNLTTQAEQVDCFANAAAHLKPGGAFVVEVVVPNLRGVSADTSSHVFAMEADHVGVEEFTDFAGQIAYSHHWFKVGDHYVTHSAPYRYVWPSELDLMAQLAGLRFRERWADWHRSPFTNASRSHVSVWEKPGSSV